MKALIVFLVIGAMVVAFSTSLHEHLPCEKHGYLLVFDIVAVALFIAAILITLIG